MLENFLRKTPTEVEWGEVFYLLQDMAQRIIDLERKLAEKDE